MNYAFSMVILIELSVYVLCVDLGIIKVISCHNDALYQLCSGWILKRRLAEKVEVFR